MTNDLIEAIFDGFTVDGQEIPVKFLYYRGRGEPYIVYQNISTENSLSGDNDFLGYVEYFDFNIYSKSNFFPILEKVKSLLKEHGFVWQPGRSSGDMFEEDTGYFHKTLNFAYMRQEENE